MQVVVVDSPGRAEAHWSAAFADDLVAQLATRDAQAIRIRCEAAARWRVHEVKKSLGDLGTERRLVAHLRAHPARFVVHVGLGAGGSPNLLWLAERMGSAAVAVVRPVEIVCRRGDWIDERGQACRTVDDVARCSVCCGRSLRRPVPTDEFEARLDMILGSLQVATAVWHDAADDPEPLRALGFERLRHGAQHSDLATAVADSLVSAPS